MEISKRIKSLREEHHMTQEDLAKVLNISRNAISNYENGIRTPDLNVVKDLCDYFNITLDSFFKDELEYRKTPNIRLLKHIFQILTIILLITTCVLSIILFDKLNEDTRAVDDITKVKESNDISLVTIKEKVDNKTYKVETIEKLKGDNLSYIIIKDRDIEITISNYYLVFGNRIAKDSQYKNYVSYDVMEIYTPQFILEISDYLNSPTVNYYKELINSEPKEDVLIAKLLTPRKEEFTISSKDLYENPYDTFNLNEDFDVSFDDARYKKYNYIDVSITFLCSGNNNKKVYLFSKERENDLYNLEEYCISIKNVYDKVTLNYIDISIKHFVINDLIYVRYSTSSLFNSSWTNNDLEITIIYRK